MDGWISAWLLTDALERFGVLRAARAALLIAVAGWLSYRVVGANVSHAAGGAAGWGVPGALLVWALWRPARSELSADIVHGVLFGLRLIMFVAFYNVARDVLMTGFHLPSLLAGHWKDLAIAAALWGGQRLLVAWIDRSERVEGAGPSVIGRKAGA